MHEISGIPGVTKLLVNNISENKFLPGFLMDLVIFENVTLAVTQI